jgi:hypothetical protein
MVERFQYKKVYLGLLFSFSIFCFFLSGLGFYMYFFVDDTFVFLVAFIGAGIGALGGIFAVIDLKKFFIEISKQGIKTNRTEITWEMVKSVNLTQKGIILHYEAGDKKMRRIGFGSLIEGCDYAKSLVTKYTTKKEAENV